MVMKKSIPVATFFVSAFVLGVLSVILLNSFFSTSVSSDSSNSLLSYHSSVCVFKNGELVGECKHNLLYDNGKNITRDTLGSVAGAVIQNISLCNATAGCGAPLAAGSETFNTFNSCGMASSQGTYNTITATPGNWTITKTFTATCDSIVTNVTRLTNVTGGIFAGNTFTSVTLQTNDQLTINWTLMIT